MNGQTFKLTLHETYYKMGFFNITVDYDKYIGEDQSSIELHLENTGSIIQGHINRTANNNGTARIMGGKDLKNWFHENCAVLDKVDIEILTPTALNIRK